MDKIMYKKTTNLGTGFDVNESTEGERIEEKVERLVNNKEPIRDASPIIYTEKKDGVLPAYNARTDRWEIAVEAMDKVHRSGLAKRDGVIQMNKKSDPAEPIKGTDGDQNNDVK